MFQVTDRGGNMWFNQKKEEERLNYGYEGAHMALTFQCEQCWMVNLERQTHVPWLDDVYVAVIH